MKTKYKFEIFIQRNVSTIKRENCKSDKEAIQLAKAWSKNQHKVIVSNGKGWEQYEKTELTEWSYPNGMGQIKINS